MNRFAGILFAVFALCINVVNATVTPYHWKVLHHEFDSIAATLEHLESDAGNVQNRINRLEIISRKQGNPMLRARYRYWNAYFNGDLWNTSQGRDAKRSYINETLLNIDKTIYDYDYARLLLSGIGIEGEPGNNYLEQYQQLGQIVAIFQKYNDIKNEADCYRLFGILFSELHEYEKSLAYFEKSSLKYKELGMEHALVSNQGNIAVVHYYMGKTDSTKNTLRRLLQNKECLTDTNLLMSLYNNLAIVTDNTEERAFCQKNTIAIAQSHSGSRKNYYKALVAINMALHYTQEKKPVDSVLPLYDFAYKIAKEENLYRVLSPCLTGLSEIYARRGDYQKAYRYMADFQTLQDSVMGRGKITEINRQEAGKAIDEYQNRIKLQEQKISLQRKLNFFSIILLVLAACAIIFFVFYLRTRKRMNQMMLESQVVQNQQLQQEIDHQNREISSNMLIMSEEKRFLQHLLSQFEKFKEKRDLSEPCEIALRKMITEHMRGQDSWETFKLHFEKVHPDFFSKLKNKYPELSTNELKLCAYIRIGLSIKQISQMTAVLPATVKTNRYLLRKKFHLREDQSLDSFIFDI